MSDVPKSELFVGVCNAEDFLYSFDYNLAGF